MVDVTSFTVFSFFGRTVLYGRTRKTRKGDITAQFHKSSTATSLIASTIARTVLYGKTAMR